MGNMMTYSGIATKVRAMSSRLLSDEDYRLMCRLASVSEAVQWLGQLPAYADIFSRLGGQTLHRGEIERLLQKSLYADFNRLYLFSTPEPRQFLKLYFPHFEIKLLKQCLRSVFDSGQFSVDLSGSYEFFAKYSSLDLAALSACHTLEELTEALHGTGYQPLFRRLLPIPHPTLFDYEMALDLRYFSNIWRMKNRIFDGEDRKLITEAFGSRLDLLNLQWIYRAKKYFQLENEEIYPLLIPVHYRISDSTFQVMVEAETEEAFLQLAAGTGYAKAFQEEKGRPLNLEELYRNLLRRIYRSQSRRMPYSAACLNTYLFLKEEELHDIVTVVEGIRYQLPAAEIYEFIR